MKQVDEGRAEAAATMPPNRVWDETPVSVRKFVTDPEYLGVGEEVYPRILQTLASIFSPSKKHQEAVLCWGIGSGKSFLCSLALTYLVYRTLCLRNPQRYYGLAEGSPIHIVNVGPTARVAEKAIYGQIRGLVARSPWFGKYPPDTKMKRELHFPKGVEVLPGNSSEMFPLGLNVLGATMDEAAFFVETHNGEQEAAEEVYLSLQRRIQSRFGAKGLILIASSPRHGEDFIMGKLAEAETNPHLFASQKATWDVKPGFSGRRCDVGGLRVPEEMAAQFRSNPQKARRDYAALPGAAYEPFFVDMGALEAAVDGGLPPRLRRDPSPQGRGTANGLTPPRPSPQAGRGHGNGNGRGDGDGSGDGNGLARRHPVEKDGRVAEWFRPDDRAARFIHIDLGLRKDACGIAMAKMVCEGGRPVVVVELMHRIIAPSQGEVNLAAVREFVLSLRRQGFPIGQVSYDGWQSADSAQILRRHGLKVEIISVDRDLGAYETLKELANEGRLRMYRYERFLDECRRLEVIRGQKVDHPAKGSKDVADAVAGAVSEAVKTWGGEGVKGRIV